MVDAFLVDLVASDDHAHLVGLDELFDYIWAVVHYVVLLLRISRLVPGHAKHFIRCRRVRPEYIHSHLLKRVVDLSEFNLQWTSYLLNVINLLE